MSKYSRLFVLSAIFFVACNSKTENQSHESPEKEEIDSHQFMVNTLARINQEGEAFDYYHWNSQQANEYLKMVSVGSPQEQVNAWFSYVTQLLLAGETDACIQQLEQFVKNQGIGVISKETLNDQSRSIVELLAIAHLRKAEQENCCINHTSESCIIPIQSNGLHKQTSGSENAIKLYKILYDKYGLDKYKWLINLGYMTLGKYPHGVPEKYLIKLSQKSNEYIGEFENVANDLGLAMDGLAGGTCVDDFNNDGLLDVFASSYGMFDNVRLFIQSKDGTFEEKTAESGLTGILGGLNTIHADYDNDGFLDILILRGGWLGKAATHPNSLLKNNGDGTFTDVTYSCGLLSYHPTQTAAWGDFNNDGFLDLFIGNESGSDYSHPCELFQNNGDGTFKEVSATYELGGITGFIKGISWGDINNDGWIDLYISELGGNNRLYKNNHGTFENIAESAGVESPFFSFPCWFWDVNNDGFEDLFVGSYDIRNHTEVAGDYAKELQGKKVETEKPKLFLNQGNETFKEVSEQYGVDKTMYCMGSNFGDLDNDGYLDFYIGTGAPDFSTVVPNRMFRNVEGKSFEEVTFQGGFGHVQKGHGVAFADFDNDGDQDVYAVMGGAYEGDTFKNAMFLNPGNIHNWIVLNVVGSRKQNPIGARVKLLLDNGRVIHRTIGTGSSFGSNSLALEIGLGLAKKVTKIEVTFSEGNLQVFKDIEVNKSYLIADGKLF